MGPVMERMALIATDPWSHQPIGLDVERCPHDGEATRLNPEQLWWQLHGTAEAREAYAAKVRRWMTPRRERK
jgi:hypothetical protein